MRFAKLTTVLAAATMFFAACSGGDGGDGGEGSAGSDTGWTRVAPTELQQMLEQEDVYLVNTHVPFEGDIPGTDASIPYTDVVSRIDDLPTSGDPKLVLYCRSGNMSTQAAQDLVDAGVTGFYELDGGFIAWEAAGLPFEGP